MLMILESEYTKLMERVKMQTQLLQDYRDLFHALKPFHNTKHLVKQVDAALTRIEQTEKDLNNAN